MGRFVDRPDLLNALEAARIAGYFREDSGHWGLMRKHAAELLALRENGHHIIQIDHLWDTGELDFVEKFTRVALLQPTLKGEAS